MKIWLNVSFRIPGNMKKSRFLKIPFLRGGVHRAPLFEIEIIILSSFILSH